MRRREVGDLVSSVVVAEDSDSRGIQLLGTTTVYLPSLSQERPGQSLLLQLQVLVNPVTSGCIKAKSPGSLFTDGSCSLGTLGAAGGGEHGQHGV